MSTTAREVAQELRRLADALDKEPEMVVPRFDVWMFCRDKKSFLDTVSVLPRPLKKWADNNGNTIDRQYVGYENDAVKVEASIYRDYLCKLVAPARTIPAQYECEPLLSLEEEESLVAE